jgi:hypothetical protein
MILDNYFCRVILLEVSIIWLYVTLRVLFSFFQKQSPSEQSRLDPKSTSNPKNDQM